MRTKKPIYMRYKQACGIWGHRKSSYKRHRIIPSAKKNLHVRWSWKVTSVWIKHGAMAALISSKVWVLFIALIVVVVVGSPTMDLLESVDCLLRDWLYAISRILTEKTIDSVRNERLTGHKQLISSCDNLKHDLESLLFSLARKLSPFLLHEHVLSLLVSKLCILSLHSLYKFHVSCFVFSHFNSLPPASLSLLLHFNCDFHDYLTRSRLTCIKCPSGINLL